MELKIKKLQPDAQLPTYATDGSACFDLVAIDDGSPHPKDLHGWIFGTGLAFEVPVGYVMLIFSRSGHGFKEATRLSNCVGVIDSDFRGELKVALRFDASGEHRCAKLHGGDRIAQAMIVQAPKVSLVEVDELSATQRGDGGFGSTGA